MVPYLRTILTWLGFLFKTSGPLIRAVVRQCVTLIHKLYLQTARLRLQSLGSRLFASCSTWVALEKVKVQSKATEFTATSAAFPMPSVTPGNAFQNLPAPAVQLLQANPAEHSSTFFDSRPSSMLQRDWEFKPCAPELFKRYKGRPLVKREEVKPIPAKKKDFTDKVVVGWQRVVHPEGAPYFYDDTQRVFTDANLDRRDLKTVNTLVDFLIQKAGDAVDDLTYLALEWPDRNLNVCNYYFVQHDKQLLFWVHDFEDPMRIYENVEGVKSDTHIKIALETQYWFVDTIATHCELYPNNVPIQPQLVTELKYVLLHANADFLTSDTSVVPYDFPKLQSMLELTNHVVEYVTSQSQSQSLAMPSYGDTIELPAHLMCVLARLKRLFARSKFLNFHGQVSARLSANQSVYEPEHTRGKATASLLLANVFLCGAPAAQYRFLRETWIDDILNYPRWSKYISRLNSDWSSVTIFSTVMLAVDISFLAVPGVVTAAAVLISLSAMCSVSSLVVSMVLGGESRGLGTDSAEGAASFMARKVRTQRDIEALAIMYSLPYAFLIWGMLCFVAALGINIFRFASPEILVIVSLGWVAVTSLALWPLWWGKFSIRPPSALSRKGGRPGRQVV